MNALEYKAHITRTVLNPINEELFDSKLPYNIRYFTKYNPHLFGRVLERGIDQDSFKEIFVELFRLHYEKLLFLFNQDREKMNSDDSVAVFVRKNDVSICFIVFEDHKENFFSMMPLTVLGKHGYRKCDYEINL